MRHSPIKLEFLQQHLPMVVGLPHFPQRVLSLLIGNLANQPQYEIGGFQATEAMEGYFITKPYLLTPQQLPLLHYFAPDCLSDVAIGVLYYLHNSYIYF